MQEAASRTIICSIAFIDIVGYSKRSVAEQILIKQRFNEALAEGIKDLQPTERLVLDTGDGAAISFLGDPEDALFVALKLRDHYRAMRDTPEGTRLGDEIRMGINLGPVKLVRDINSQPNIIGDGINVSERIMGFAAPLQIAVSRSYYECVSRISDDYSKLFLYEGSKTDKHVREHEVYVVSHAEDAINALRKSAMERSLSTTQPLRDIASATATMKIKRQSDSKLWVLAILGLGVIGGGIGAGVSYYAKNRKEAAAIAAKAEQLRIEQAKVDNPAAKLAGAEPKTDEAKLKVEPKTDSKLDPKLDPKLDTKTGKPKAGPTASPTTTAATNPATAEAAKGMGVVRINVAPWGVVKVDGKVVGDSPPLKRLELTPGKHRIEVVNTAVPQPYVVNVDIKAGESVNIQHSFN
jgi:class 3 adenylate cyclase